MASLAQGVDLISGEYCANLALPTIPVYIRQALPAVTASPHPVNEEELTSAWLIAIGNPIAPNS